ncbi:hypothetical protein O9992_02185 [Vibrio lentus]|nr:hypothetical protein [Vibrio lentus]
MTLQDILALPGIGRKVITEHKTMVCHCNIAATLMCRCHGGYRSLPVAKVAPLRMVNNLASFSIITL